MCRDVRFQRCAAHCFGEGLCPLGDPQSFKENPLRRDTRMLCRRSGQRKFLEIDMGRQITVPGSDQGGCGFMVL